VCDWRFKSVLLFRHPCVRRYDQGTGELVLIGERYPNREENRRWCLERLHLLLAEAHRFQAAAAGEASGGSDVVLGSGGLEPGFLLSRQGVVSLLDQQHTHLPHPTSATAKGTA
jgi:hypothetical protein